MSFGPSRVEYRRSSLWDPNSNLSSTDLTGIDEERISVSDCVGNKTSSEVLKADTDNFSKVGGTSKGDDSIESIFNAAMERAKRMQHVLSSDMHVTESS
eukprot:325672_1